MSRRDGAREPQRLRNLGLVPTAYATATAGAFMLFKLAKLPEASIKAETGFLAGRAERAPTAEPRNRVAALNKPGKEWR